MSELRSSDLHLATPPAYLDEASRLVGVLQNIQRLLAGNRHATLADVVDLVQQLQQHHGDHAELEDIIQHLVADQLLTQYRTRQTQKATVAA